MLPMAAGGGSGGGGGSGSGKTSINQRATQQAMSQVWSYNSPEEAVTAYSYYGPYMAAQGRLVKSMGRDAETVA